MVVGLNIIFISLTLLLLHALLGNGFFTTQGLTKINTVVYQKPGNCIEDYMAQLIKAGLTIKITNVAINLNARDIYFNLSE